MSKVKELLTFLDNSPTSYQVIENVEHKLLENNFTKLYKNKKWQLEEQKSYFVINENSSLMAFSLGEDLDEGFNIIASHTDSPLIKIKPNAEMFTNEHYVGFNVEIYGGPILTSWFDRGLSIAGTISYRDDGIVKTKAVDFKRTILTIPSVAIHLDKDRSVNTQKHMKPIASFLSSELSKDDCLYNLIKSEVGCEINDILGFDLYLYDNQKGEVFGINNEFYQSKNLDDLLMVFTSLEAFLNSASTKTKVLLLSDNEEIGSRSATGAESVFFENVLERIFLSFGKNREDYFISISNSYCLSCDLAHAYHPNYKEKYDETNRALLGKGIVIKYSANKSYATESHYSSIFKNELNKRNIEFQEFVNRSDIKGGSTIGPMLSKKFGFSAIDAGPAILGMHSVRETGAIFDIENTIDALSCFYEMK